MKPFREDNGISEEDALRLIVGGFLIIIFFIGIGILIEFSYPKIPLGTVISAEEIYYQVPAKNPYFCSVELQDDTGYYESPRSLRWGGAWCDKLEVGTKVCQRPAGYWGELIELC